MTTAAEAPAADVKLARRAGIASFVGTAIEWYDYFIFSTASTLAFGKVFFPNQTPLVALLISFSIFGVGFFARPVGGIIFGIIGDRKGRKSALIATLLIMGLSTTLIGCLPGSAQIGVLAPILLVVLRLAQGFATGGEWGGAATVAVEFAPEGKRGRYGSFAQMGNAAGIVLSTGIFTLVSLMPEDQLIAWGWRIPFLASIVLVGAGFIIRRRLTETPEFIKAAEEAKRIKEERAASNVAEVRGAGFRDFVRQYWGRTFLSMGVALGVGTMGYVMLTYVVTYSANFTTISQTAALAATTVAAAIGVVVFYLMGLASDRWDARRVVMFGSFVGMLLAFPFFWLLDTNSVIGLYAIALLGFNVAYGPQYSAEPALFSALFPTRVRYLGLSLAVQVPSILFGLTATFMTALLIASHGTTWSLSVYILGVQAITFVCAYFLKRPLAKAREGR